MKPPPITTTVSDRRQAGAGAGGKREPVEVEHGAVGEAE
jgi:hypothetical protein